MRGPSAAWGIKPELPNNIQAEAPAIKEYAARTGNPLNIQAEGLKAAQGVAKEGLDHYSENILSPHADVKVPLQSGESELGGVANLGNIDKRITELNH